MKDNLERSDFFSNGGDDLEDIVKKEKSHQDVELFYSILESADTDKRDHKLKALFELQKRVVQKEMHKAMSPISAISGYLELMEMLLQQKSDEEHLERYRGKIEEGIAELSEIVEELYEMFDGEDGSENDLVISELNNNSSRCAN